MAQKHTLESRNRDLKNIYWNQQTLAQNILWNQETETLITDTGINKHCPKIIHWNQQKTYTGFNKHYPKKQTLESTNTI